MLFRRTVIAALLVGVMSGLVLSLAQVLAINPIISEAETFESAQVHDHGAHEHGAEAWAPADGAERTGYTVMANISAGIGFSAITLALMSQLQLLGVTRTSVLRGMVWGLGGFVVFFVAPGIGLPPEIPGIEAAPVAHRQAWWALTVCSVGAGLMVLSFAPVGFKALGLILVVLPYGLNIPRHDGPAFAHPDIDVVATLTRLHQEFIVVSGLSNFAFWLVLGALCAWSLNTWVLNGQQLDGEGGESVSL